MGWVGAETPFWAGGLFGSPAGGAYTNWKFGDPNDGLLGRDCLVKAPLLAGGFWESRSCNDHDAFICEREFQGLSLPELALVREVELVNARGNVVEPPLAADGVTPNPNGLRKLVAHFTEPIDPISFRISNHAIAAVANHLGVVPQAPALESFYTSVAFSNDNRIVELSIDPARVNVGSTYELGINTKNLVLQRGVTVGRSGASELKFAAATVLRPDGVAPAITSFDPPLGATRVGRTLESWPASRSRCRS